MIVVQSTNLQLELDPAHSRWSLSSRQVSLHGAQLGVSYHLGRNRQQALGTWKAADVSKAQQVTTIHGLAHQMHIDFGADHNGLDVTLTFSLLESSPLLLWQLRLHNLGSQPIFLDRLDMLRGALRFAGPAPELAFFSNGWQTLSTSGAYGARDRPRRTRLGLLQRPVNVNPTTPHSRRVGHFSSDLFGVIGDRVSRRAVVTGFLSERQHFGSVEARLSSASATLGLWGSGDGARLDPDAGFETDWACLCLIDVDGVDPLGTYLEAVVREHRLSPAVSGAEGGEQSQDRSSLRHRIPVGWCSWYHYFQHVLPQGIQDNLSAVVSLQPELRLDLVQIDDGFESQVGDWYTFTPAFPQGLAPLVAEIRSAGLTPGLWLAPFLVHPRSRLAAERPEWLLRGKLKRPVNAGYLMNTLMTALDLTHPDAQEYTREVVSTAVHRWGFPYLKLDFLYAAALPGRRYDPTRTRAQALRAALDTLRTAAGEAAFLLGCGCPLGPAIGIVDAMRIGPDTDVRWKPTLKGLNFIYRSEPHIPAARNNVQNTLARLPLNQRWWINDPDCLLLRPDTELTLAEVETLASLVALNGGSLFISDYLPSLPPDRLRMAAVLLPLIGQPARAMDWLDSRTPCRLRLDLGGPCGSWHLLALFNWQDEPQEMTLRLADYGLEGQRFYWGREFWSGRLYEIREGSIPLGVTPAHGAALLAVRPGVPGASLYLGGDLHLSQGLEVSAWEPSEQGLGFHIQRPGHFAGLVDLHLPGPIRSGSLNGNPLNWEAVAAGVYRLPVEAYRTATIQLFWGE